MFENREEAGRALGRALEEYRGTRAVVLGLLRGGVVVAAQVAAALELPLDVACPRKLGAPHNPEYAIGAVGEHGEMVWNEQVRRCLGVSMEDLEAAARREIAERIRPRLERYRKLLPARDPAGCTAILVDDGLATGMTMRAAVADVRVRGVKEAVVAVPVGAASSVRALEQEADRVVCLRSPDPFLAIGLHYRDFTQVTEEEVEAVLREAARRLAARGS